MNPEHIEKIVQRHRGEQGALFAILEDIQNHCHYLPEDALRKVSQLTGESLVDIFGVATFYKAFSLKPRGNHHVSVCLGTACHVRSAPGLVDEFTQQLGITPGETTGDGEFTLETVNCLGACALGPIVLVDGRYFSNVKRPDVKKIISRAGAGFRESTAERAGSSFPLEVVCPHCRSALLDTQNLIEDHPAISLMASSKGTSGWVRLSSLFGSRCHESEHAFADDTQLSYSCPTCGRILTTATPCIECGFPVGSLAFSGGGSLHICSLWGCRSHRISLNGLGSPGVAHEEIVTRV